MIFPSQSNENPIQMQNTFAKILDFTISEELLLLNPISRIHYKKGLLIFGQNIQIPAIGRSKGTFAIHIPLAFSFADHFYDFDVHRLVFWSALNYHFWTRSFMGPNLF